MKSTITKIKLTAWLVAMISLTDVAGCAPSEYSAAPLSGRVIDKVTKQPVKDAYVVALYGLHGGLKGTYIAPLHYEEARSDKDGYFHFNGFIDISIDLSHAPKNAFVLHYDPLLYFFAEGYLPWEAYRNIPSAPPGYYLKSPLDGVVMELEPISGIVQENAEKSHPFISGLSSQISRGYKHGNYINVKCAYEQIPQTFKFLTAVDQEYLKTTKYFSAIPLHSYASCNIQGD